MTHLLAHGRVVVGVTGGSVVGFGATRQIGRGSGAVSMLCDLFVDPRLHGSGCGRAMLAELRPRWNWPGPESTGPTTISRGPAARTGPVSWPGATAR